MSEVGTLQELNVKPGDVVEYCGSNGDLYTVATEAQSLIHSDGSIHYYCWWSYGKFRLISRASDTPKLWRDMTPEEKGALLLAWHDRVGTEVFVDGKWIDKLYMTFCDDNAYRVKTEPNVETVEILDDDLMFTTINGHKITLNTINGKPDCASIKMEPLK